MKRLLNIGLLLSSMFGYLEWGKDMHSFLFEMERDIFFKSDISSDSFFHPLIFVPLIGQVLILITIFQKEPNRMLSLIGLACLSVIMLMILLVGILSSNFKIWASSIPFIVFGIMVLKYNRKSASQLA